MIISENTYKVNFNGAIYLSVTGINTNHDIDTKLASISMTDNNGEARTIKLVSGASFQINKRIFYKTTYPSAEDLMCNKNGNDEFTWEGTCGSFNIFIEEDRIKEYCSNNSIILIKYGKKN